MNLELLHRWHCPYSRKVRDFIDQNNLGSQIKLSELDETTGAIERLVQLTGKQKSPCLLIDGRPLLESDEIVRWLRDNLLDRGNHASV